ncbi:putative ribosomal N-acetyltransferase YdaF [Abditibacteriota bacterium]|nr:putative ribosomal N-acetyltransferase YdaF [Abditibacteriota bacterium]
MNIQPTLETPRLRLRPFQLNDAPTVQHLAGAREIAAVTLNIPHPYEDGMAETFIASLEGAWQDGRGATFAIALRESGELVGCMGLGVDKRFNRAELGYWIGLPFWGEGYATEAARAIIEFGFQTLKLHRIYASHLEGNPASGRVQEKIGMKYEGCLRDHYLKWGQYHNAHFRGILVTEWDTETSC